MLEKEKYESVIGVLTPLTTIDSAMACYQCALCARNTAELVYTTQTRVEPGNKSIARAEQFVGPPESLTHIVDRKRKRNDDDLVRNLEGQITILKTYVAYLQQSHPSAEPLNGRGGQTAVDELLDGEASRGKCHAAVDGEDEHLYRDSTEDDASTDGFEDFAGSIDNLGDAEPQRKSSGVGPEHPEFRQEITGDGKIMRDAPTDELSRLLWTLRIGDSGETTFQGPSSNFLAQARSSVYDDTHIESLLDVKDAHPLAQHHMDDSCIKHQLIQSFLDNVNIYHCFVEEPFYTTKIFDPHNLLPLQFLHATMMAAGSVYTKDPALSSAGHSYAAFAESVALECCREYPSHNVIRGLAILSWTKLGLEQNNMGWIYNSLAASLVLHLGLNFGMSSQLVKQEISNSEQEEVQRHIFWSVCLLDRVATAVLGRQCTLPWRRVTVPQLDFSDHGPDNRYRLVFALQCRLWYIFDQYMDQIYSPNFVDLDKTAQIGLLTKARDALFTFRETILVYCPLEPDGINSEVALLQLSYHSAIILVHRPYLSECHPNVIKDLALESMSGAADAGTKILKRSVQLLDISRMPFFTVHHVLTIALTHLLLTTLGQPRSLQRSVRGLRICLEVLKLLEGTWYARASSSIKTIQETARRWRVVFALPIHLSEPPLRSSTSAITLSLEHMYNNLTFWQSPSI